MNYEKFKRSDRPDRFRSLSTAVWETTARQRRVEISGGE